MDIGIFIFAIIQLCRKKYQWVFASVFILASGYLEINYGNGGASQIPFKHQISDTGFILYGIVFIYSGIKYGLAKSSILHKIILSFYVFIVINSFIDLVNGVTFTDVLKYSRGWVYLSVVWIEPNIYRRYLKGTLRIIFTVVLTLTVLIIFQNLTKSYWLAQPIDGDRGIKPSFYVMLFIPLLWFEVLKYGKFLKWLFISVLLISVIMNLKQTYILTIASSFVIHLIIFKRKNIAYILKYGVIILVSSILLLVTNDKLRERVLTSSSAIENVTNQTSSDNFSYRLLHAIERLDYIMKDPLRTSRGIGFIHEENFKTKVFDIGLMDTNRQEIIQLDTGDIAWSIFFVRFGLLGVFIFLTMYIFTLRELYIKAHVSKISGVLFSFLIACLCITSLGNAVIAYGYFYMIPLMTINSIRFRT